MKKRRLVLSISCIFLIAVLLAPSVLAAPPGGGGSTRYKVHGYVKDDSTGNPIASAKVNIYADGVTYLGYDYTDSNGYFVKYTYTQAECYKATATKSGYNSASKIGIRTSTTCNIGTIYMSSSAPPAPIAPTIGTPEFTSDSAIEGTVTGSVTWHYTSYNARAVWIVYDDVEHLTVRDGDSYSTTFALEPTRTIDWKIKATETWYEGPFQELKSATSYSSTYTIDSCIPTIEVTVDDILEKQATINWTVDWGREGKGTDSQVYLEFKHGFRTSWNPSKSVTQSGDDDYSYTVDGLVMNNQYKVGVQVSHVFDGYLCESSQVIKTFTTEPWNPVNKYAVVINLDFGDEPCQGPIYLGHLNAFNALTTIIDDDISDSKAYEYDYPHYFHCTPETTVEELQSHIKWPSLSPELGGPAVTCGSEDFVFIYFVGHGGFGGGANLYGYIGPSDDRIRLVISGPEINGALDYIDYGKMVVVIEACFSGKLIQFLRAEDRIVITSSSESYVSDIIDVDEDEDITFLMPTFSHAFITSLDSGSTFYDAFIAGCNYAHEHFVSDGGPNMVYQDPWLDDYSTDESDNDIGSYADKILPLYMDRDGLLAYVLSWRM